MTRKSKLSKAVGKGIENEKARHAEKLRAQADKLAAKMGVGIATGASVLEQSSLDDLIATIGMKKEAWADDTGEAEFVKGPRLISYGSPNELLMAEQNAVDRRELMSIPRRPAWEEGMSIDELADLEMQAFLDWRRELQTTAESEGLHLTPYERNLDFWRQLWRCVERSDLLVQIVDARDPDFYLCRDLATYIDEVGHGEKRMLLLCNKADFLSSELRLKWKTYFESQGIDAVFFSGLYELKRQQKESVSQPRPRAGLDDEEEKPQAQTLAEDDIETKKVSIFQKMEASWVEDVIETEGKDKEAEPNSEAKEKEDEEAENGSKTAAYVDPFTAPLPETDSEEERWFAADPDAQPAVQAEKEDDQVAEVELEEGDDVLDASGLIDELMKRLPSKDREAAAGNRLGTIGFVGYPNVGKSTVINALVGSTRVGMSRKPGKTKHIQTLELPAMGITLCDCPGLVFPSVAATKAHLVINNTVHIDDLRECFTPIALIIQKIGLEKVLARYDCGASVQDARKRSGDHVLDDAHAFLAALAVARQHFLRAGVPDENWAARKVLKDYVSGALLCCEEPRMTEPAKEAAAAAAASTAATASGSRAREETAAEPPKANDDEEDAGSEGSDFGDVQAFIDEVSRLKPRNMTKRRMRALNKKMTKGGNLEAADFVNVSRAAPHGVRSM